MICLSGYFFYTSLCLLGRLLAAQLSPVAQTQQFWVAGRFFCNKLFFISVADSHYAKGETAKASVQTYLRFGLHHLYNGKALLESLFCSRFAAITLADF